MISCWEILQNAASGPVLPWCGRIRTQFEFEDAFYLTWHDGARLEGNEMSGTDWH